MSVISKSWYFARIELYIYVVGQGLAPAERISKYVTAFGCCQLNSISYRRDNPCGCPTKAPSDEGAAILSKMTEGEKAINSKFSLSLLPSRLRRATYCPLAVSRFCLCGLERRTKSTAAPTDALFIRHRRRSHMLPVRGRLYSASIFI